MIIIFCINFQCFDISSEVVDIELNGKAFFFLLSIVLMLKTPPFGDAPSFSKSKRKLEKLCHAVSYHRRYILGRDVLMFYEAFKVGNDFSYTYADGKVN